MHKRFAWMKRDDDVSGTSAKGPCSRRGATNRALPLAALRSNAPNRLRWLVVLLLLAVPATVLQLGAAAQTETIEHGDLSIVVRDNARSPDLLSGIVSLRNLRHAPDYEAFDPDNPGASAGLNFEHIISGHRSRHNSFTPRRGRYSLRRLTEEHTVQLERLAADSPWKVASTMQLTVRAPHYIDFEFRCTPQDAALFGRQGYAIFFFANYMNDVAAVPLHFRGRQTADGEEVWIAADAPQTHPDWNGGGNYRSVRADELGLDDNVQFRLNTWSYDWPRISKPFYYGRAGNQMVLILMFDRLSSTRDQIRFSLYKFKLNQYPRPAWDFQYVINQVRSGEQYGFRGRLVWKKFVSREDCLQEYERWSSQLR